MLKEIFLVRHAQSEANKEGYFAGWSDSPLTELGIKQAIQLRKRLAKEGIGEAFCSDLGRAIQTLELIGLKLPTTYSPLLREKNYGKLEGMKWSKKFEEHHLKPFLKAPGGESTQDVQKRVWTFFQEKVFTSKKEKVLVVSHHNALVSFACTLLKIPLKEWRRLRLGNASLSIFEKEEEIWRLKLWNSLSYLGKEEKRFP